MDVANRDTSQQDRQRKADSEWSSPTVETGVGVAATRRGKEAWEEGSGWVVGGGLWGSNITNPRFEIRHKASTRVVRTCPNQGIK